MLRIDELPVIKSTGNTRELKVEKFMNKEETNSVRFGRANTLLVEKLLVWSFGQHWTFQREQSKRVNKGSRPGASHAPHRPDNKHETAATVRDSVSQHETFDFLYLKWSKVVYFTESGQLRAFSALAVYWFLLASWETTGSRIRSWKWPSAIAQWTRIAPWSSSTWTWLNRSWPMLFILLITSCVKGISMIMFTMHRIRDQ